MPPPEAQFCGDCGAPLIRSGTATLEPVKTAELDVTERLGNSTDGELVLAEAETLPLTPAPPHQTAADDSTDTLDQTAGWKDTFLKWLRMPGLRISIEISFLMAIAVFSYRLGSHQQTQVGGELTQTSKQAPSVSPPPEPEAGVAAEVPVQTPSAFPPPKPENGGEKQEESKIAAPNPEAVPPPLLPSPPSVTEQPLSSPRFYRVTTPTALRDKPTWTGKEMAQLQSNTLIQVVATVGDWLKVESKSNPPKPPGYVWKEDAKLK